MSNGFKDIVSIVFAIVLIIVALLFWKDYKSKAELEKQIDKQGTVIVDLNASNKSLKEATEIKTESDKISENIVKETEAVKEVEIQKVVTEATKVDKKIQDIRVTFDKKIKESKSSEESVKLVEERSKSISRARIESLWANYCNFEPNESECKA